MPQKQVSGCEHTDSGSDTSALGLRSALLPRGRPRCARPPVWGSLGKPAPESPFPGLLGSDTLWQHAPGGSRPPDSGAEPGASSVPGSAIPATQHRPKALEGTPSRGGPEQAQSPAWFLPSPPRRRRLGQQPLSKAGLMGGESPGQSESKTPNPEHSVGRAQETDTWSRLGPGSQNCQEGGQRTGEGCRPRWGEGVVEDSQGAPHPGVV